MPYKCVSSVIFFSWTTFCDKILNCTHIIFSKMWSAASIFWLEKFVLKQIVVGLHYYKLLFLFFRFRFDYLKELKVIYFLNNLIYMASYYILIAKFTANLNVFLWFWITEQYIIHLMILYWRMHVTNYIIVSLSGTSFKLEGIMIYW